MKLNFKALLFIVIALVLVIVLVNFFIPRRINNSFYDTSVVFDRLTITKFYFDKELRLPSNVDYVINDEEVISKIRSLLYKVKVTPTIKINDYHGEMYEFVLRNTNTGDKISVDIIAKSYLFSSNDRIKHHKIFNKESAEELVDFIESLIEDMKNSQE